MKGQKGTGIFYITEYIWRVSTKKYLYLSSFFKHSILKK